VLDLVGNDAGEEPEATAHPLVADDDEVASSCSGPAAELPDSSIVMISRSFL
jgi:hypothetical protein